MNFQELYYQNPYQTSFTAEVRSCEPVNESGSAESFPNAPSDGYIVILDRTCFYPEGGGQPPDRGYLLAAASGESAPEANSDEHTDDFIHNYDSDTRIPVLDVQDSDRGVLHLTGRPLAPGSCVHGLIDWDFRFRLMQHHTGEHIISGLAHRKFGCDNVGFHMSDVITLDLSRPFDWEQAMELEREANEIIYADLPVEVLYPSDAELDSIDYRSKKELAGAVRIIHVPMADNCACCGLHVSRTGEIGLVKVLSLMHHRGGVRLTMLAGKQALLDYEMRTDETAAIGQMLSVKPEETADAVRHLLDASLAKDQRIAQINQRYFQAKADSFSENNDLILCLEEQMNQVELRKFCDLLVKSGKGTVCAVLTETAPETWQYCIGSTTVDLREAARTLNEQLNGRGGGKPVMIQGTFHASAARIEAALRALV